MKEFMIGWASIHMIRIGPVVMNRRSIFGKRTNGVQKD
jgi:hypothetical protein